MVSGEDINTTVFALSIVVGMATFASLYMRDHYYGLVPDDSNEDKTPLTSNSSLSLLVSVITFSVFYFGWDASFSGFGSDSADNPTEILKEWKTK